jgi:hypothetical protein
LQKGGIPLFGKEGLGEILKEYVWPIMDSLVSKYQATQKTFFIKATKTKMTGALL